MKKNYRNLTKDEVIQLKNNDCSCDDWNLVKVKNGFDTRFIRNTLFSGNIKLGVYQNYFELEGGVKKHSGIYNAIVHNCEIGDNVLIENINGYIANYDINDNSYIEDCNTIVVDGKSSFGNGVKVAVLDETGGREVIIHDQLSSHLAYIHALYRYNTKLISKIEDVVLAYAKSISSERGYIGKDVCIKNVRYIKNVRIGDYCHIEDASRLENGSLNSNFHASIYIGSDVIAENFIISSGAEVDSGASLNRCFIGQSCKIGHTFSATDSLFFANCQAENGEACSVFAGPYTVTHHKSTLLIGAMFSFYNAGSGSNQSNHMYKLGPIHQGIVERGSKTTSNSYIMWPGHIGAFSLVMGRHYTHIDAASLPFSYIIEKDGSSYIAPAVNLRTVGTARDVLKWPKRDTREDANLLDNINFSFLNPYIAGKVLDGINILLKIQEEQGEDAPVYAYNNCLISNSALKKGIDLYKTVLDKYVGDVFIKQLTSNEKTNKKENLGVGRWVDLSGMITPKSKVDKVLGDIENGKLNTIGDINKAFSKLHDSFDYYEWNWTLDMMNNHYTDNEKDLKVILQKWVDASIKIDTLICEDAKKEFSDDLTIGFGIDGSDEDKALDLASVRGTYEDNQFVKSIQQQIKEYEQIYNKVIKLL